MIRNLVFDNVNEALPTLLADLLEDGQLVSSRAGSTLELPFTAITLQRPTQRWILLPGRKANLAAQIAETAWVLFGRNDIEWLARYLPRARTFSDDGSTWRGGYGARLRRWARRDAGDVIDQLAWVVDQLRAKPDTRQAVMTIWDPDIDTAPGLDIPCNDWLHFLMRNGALDLHVAVRSNDIMWGWSGVNVVEWSVLLEVVAGLVGARVGSLHFSISSLHLYAHHFDRAKKLAGQAAPAISRFPHGVGPAFDASALPTPDVDGLDAALREWMYVEEAIRTGAPDAQQRVDAFPEPMLRSWLRVLQWWWSNDTYYLRPLYGTALRSAARVALAPKPADTEPPSAAAEELVSRRAPSAFISYVVRLHDEKHAAYGDSWKRRGEMLGILANIARKIDRLEGASATSDETAADTAIDLMVYLAKYATWLEDQRNNGTLSDTPDEADRLLLATEAEFDVAFKPLPDDSLPVRNAVLISLFNTLETMAKVGTPEREKVAHNMLRLTYALARTLWERESNAGPR